MLFRVIFIYVYNDGVILICGGGFSLSFCLDWFIMIFDYNFCFIEEVFLSVLLLVL